MNGHIVPEAWCWNAERSSQSGSCKGINRHTSPRKKKKYDDDDDEPGRFQRPTVGALLINLSRRGALRNLFSMLHDPHRLPLLYIRHRWRRNNNNMSIWVFCNNNNYRTFLFSPSSSSYQLRWSFCDDIQLRETRAVLKPTVQSTGKLCRYQTAMSTWYPRQTVVVSLHAKKGMYTELKLPLACAALSFILVGRMARLNWYKQNYKRWIRHGDRWRLLIRMSNRPFDSLRKLLMCLVPCAGLQELRKTGYHVAGTLGSPGGGLAVYYSYRQYLHL